MAFAYVSQATAVARKVRIQYPGAIYHVMNRGDHRERIFEDDQDRQQFLRALEARRLAELGKQIKPLRRAWCLGSEHFKQEMLRYIEAQRGQWHGGPELQESSEAKAERLILEALQQEGLGRQ